MNSTIITLLLICAIICQQVLAFAEFDESESTIGGDDVNFDRNSRHDYRPLQFGKKKRADDGDTFRPLQFGKRNAPYRPLQFGRRSADFRPLQFGK